MTGAPLPPVGVAPSPIKVAMFDGGVDADAPLLRGFVDEHHISMVPLHPECLAHGSAVAGAILHGPLNPFSSRAVLPVPALSIHSLRVFPISDPADMDLREIVGQMERIIPQLVDAGIRIVNLSFGPPGAITDEEISPFTAALDRLAYAHDFLAVVAVGNDHGRIQAPADSVNCLSVGAVGRKRRAVDYSAAGPGRPGASRKPDVLAFGGDDDAPFHLVSLNASARVLDYGTSFAAPLVTRRCAMLMSRRPELSPLLVRAVVIHQNDYPGSRLASSVLFEHVLAPGEEMEVEVPLPVEEGAALAWTLVVLAPTQEDRPAEYVTATVASALRSDADDAVAWETVTRKAVALTGAGGSAALRLKAHTRCGEGRPVRFAGIATVERGTL